MTDRAQATGEPRQPGGDHEDEQLVAVDRISEGAGPGGIVANRDQHLAEGRAHDPPGEGEAGQDQGQPGVVEEERLAQVEAEELPRDPLQAVLPAGHAAPLVGEEVDHLREGEGDHREVDAGSPHGQVADRHGQRHGDQGAAEHRDGERGTGMDGDEAGDVRGAAPEGGVAEGQQAGDVVPVQQDRAGRRGEEAGQQVEQRRLARAVGAHESVHGAGRHAQVDRVDRPEAGELLRQPPGLEDHLGTRPGPVPACPAGCVIGDPPPSDR